MNTIRHLVVEPNATGQSTYRFVPSKLMRKAGYRGESYGADEARAHERVSQFNEEWDRIRASRLQEQPDAKAGTIGWLCGRFQADPTWYAAKAARTREEIDYALTLFRAADFEDVPVRLVRRKHLRGYYNKLRTEHSAHKARKVMKWVRRIFTYAIDELELREDHPMFRFEVEQVSGRRDKPVWLPEQVARVIAHAQAEHKHEKQGNIIIARPSIAMAVQLAYDVSLPQQDILALTWTQYDGQALEVTQIKPRGNRDLYLPLSAQSLAMLETMKRTRASTHIIVNEETGQPYSDKNEFGRVFRKVRARAKVSEDLTFQDLRRTALTELGNSGATNVELGSFGGHRPTSPSLNTYVKPDRSAALAARAKRDAKKV